MNQHRRSKPRKAVTLVEMLVLLVIAALMVCLMLPALVGARAQKRKNVCQKKMTDLILAVHGFESATQTYPAGVLNPEGPVRQEPKGMHHSWIVQLLPFIDEQSVFEKTDPGISVYDEYHATVRKTMIPSVACPSAPPNALQSSYAACHHDLEAPIDTDNHGVFFLNSAITKADVVDGMEFTLFLGEKRNAQGTTDLGWMSGTRATLRNTGTPLNQVDAITTSDFVGGFGSWHPGVTHLCKGDGSVIANSDNIDSIVYRQLGHRSDGAEGAERNGK